MYFTSKYHNTGFEFWREFQVSNLMSCTHCCKAIQLFQEVAVDRPRIQVVLGGLVPFILLGKKEVEKKLLG